MKMKVNFENFKEVTYLELTNVDREIKTFSRNQDDDEGIECEFSMNEYKLLDKETQEVITIHELHSFENIEEVLDRYADHEEAKELELAFDKMYESYDTETIKKVLGDDFIHEMEGIPYTLPRISGGIKMLELPNENVRNYGFFHPIYLLNEWFEKDEPLKILYDELEFSNGKKLNVLMGFSYDFVDLKTGVSTSFLQINKLFLDFKGDREFHSSVKALKEFNKESIELLSIDDGYGSDSEL